MYAMTNLFVALRRALIVTAIFICGVLLLGLLLALWFNLSMMVWHDYGDLTFMYYLTGCALFLALILVAAW